MDNKAAGKILDQETTLSENLEDPDPPEEHPVINIVINPSEVQNINSQAGNVPLFVRKLWKIVNDESIKDVISWNETGDGFILHDQLKFISTTLPRYFKHNQLSSFIRQLNLYGFHKVQPLQHVQRDDCQFSHPFFLKDLPQLLPLVKRKTQASRLKTSGGTTTEPPENPEQSPEVNQLMSAIQDIKAKSDAISNEMSKLRQENAALWGEMNSLRVNNSKQTKVINKLIHFLIAYMQKHHHSRKSGRTVSTSNSNKFLKTGPKIMELDYRYKNNPVEFWTDFDNRQEIPDHNVQEAYTVVEPAEINIENGEETQPTANSPNMRVSSAIEEILPSSDAFNQLGGSQSTQQIPQFDYTNTRPSSSKSTNSALQRSVASKDNVGYLIDNSRVEMNNIKELFKNLTPDEMSTFYKLVNENYKIQEDDIAAESEKELISLAEMIPSGSLQEYNIHMPEQELGPLIDIVDQPSELEGSSVLDNIIQQQNTNMSATEELSNTIQEPDVSGKKIDETSFDNIISDDLLNTDDFLHDVSVDQYFNID